MRSTLQLCRPTQMTCTTILAQLPQHAWCAHAAHTTPAEAATHQLPQELRSVNAVLSIHRGCLQRRWGGGGEQAVGAWQLDSKLGSADHEKREGRAEGHTHITLRTALPAHLDEREARLVRLAGHRSQRLRHRPHLHGGK